MNLLINLKIINQIKKDDSELLKILKNIINEVSENIENFNLINQLQKFMNL